MSVFCKFTTLVLKKTSVALITVAWFFLNVFSTWKENAAILAFCLWQAQIEDLNSGKPKRTTSNNCESPRLIQENLTCLLDQISSSLKGRYSKASLTWTDFAVEM